MRNNIQEICFGKKQTCRLCGKDYICDYSYSCPYCGIETIVIDFIENIKYCNDDVAVSLKVGQLREIAKYYRTKKIEVINNDR